MGEQPTLTLDNVYKNLRDVGGYSSIEKLYKSAKKILPQLKREQVRNYLAAQDSYTLFKQKTKKFSRRKIKVQNLDEQWSCDIMDMSPYKKSNDGYVYCLIAVDIFSRMAFAVPLKTKSGKEVSEAFQAIFDSSNRIPYSLQTDQGKVMSKNCGVVYQQTEANVFDTL